MSLTVRKITDNDRNEFLKLGREFYSSEAVLHGIPEEYHVNAFAELMRSDEYLDCRFFEIEGSIAGYVLLAKSYSREAGGIVIWIDELYIKPKYRGRGIGSQFFEWLEANLPAARYRLEIEPDNKRAENLYRKMGYDILPYVQMVKE